jgi:TatD DNase family protein
MVDTHAHLGVCEPEDDELVAAARRTGVRRILTVGLDERSNREAIAAAEEHEGVFASVGRHPNSAAGFDEAAAGDIEELATHELVRAIGETGLDYYRDSAPRDAQRAAFSAQIGVARRTRLPLVIHLRDQPGTQDALDDTFATLSAEAEDVTVILHCCSVPPDRIAEAIEHGWYCSFAGNVTYPKSNHLRETSRRTSSRWPSCWRQSEASPTQSWSTRWRRMRNGSSDGERARHEPRPPPHPTEVG